MAVNASHILSEPTRLELPDTVTPCIWRIAVGYRKNWTVMGDADLVPAPTITEALRQELKQNYRLDGTGLNDVARLTRHPGAIDMVVESLFDEQADAAALAAQIFAMFAPGRELWSIPLANTGHRVGINAAINLTWPRGGCRKAAISASSGAHMTVAALPYWHLVRSGSWRLSISATATGRRWMARLSPQAAPPLCSQPPICKRRF